MSYQQNATLQKIIAQKLLYLAGKSVNFHNKQILDVGSGSGFIAQNLVQNGINPQNITQIDNNQESLNYAQKFGKILQTDFNFSIKTEQKYDIIFSSMALHWAKNLPQTISFLKNILNEGGYIFISLPTTDSLSKIYNIVKISQFQFSTKEISNMNEILSKVYFSNCYTALKNIHIERLILTNNTRITKEMIKKLKVNNTRWCIGFFSNI